MLGTHSKWLPGHPPGFLEQFCEILSILSQAASAAHYYEDLRRQCDAALAQRGLNPTLRHALMGEKCQGGHCRRMMIRALVAEGRRDHSCHLDLLSGFTGLLVRLGGIGESSAEQIGECWGARFPTRGAAIDGRTRENEDDEECREQRRMVSSSEM